MERQRVESSMIRSVGYGPMSRTLEVEFHDNAIYQYYEVPEQVYRGLLEAESKGSYFSGNIRDKYRYAKVGGKAA